MAYPFLYSFANSVLQKLDHCNLNEFGNPNDVQKDVEMLKSILIHLPTILQSKKIFGYWPKRRKLDHDDDESSIMLDIQESVFDLHHLLNKHIHPSSDLSWNDVVRPLTKFQDHLHPQSSKKEEQLLSSISFSIPKIESQDVKVNELPPHLVPCLAYCALYPKDSIMVRETLVNQWMAEGFLELQTPSSSSGVSGDLELEDIGNRYFMELLSMGVFVKPLFGFRGSSSNNQHAVTVHSCEIHSQMHDFARQITQNEVQIIEKSIRSNPFVAGDSGISWKGTVPQRKATLLYTSIHENALALHRQSFNLNRTCLYFDSMIQVNVMKRAGLCLSKLQILDLSNTRFIVLPESLGKTGRLRYLAVSRNTSLKRLGDINWSSLQTLAVDGCVNLEKVNLEHASRIRHLYYTSKEATLEVHTSTLRILQLSYCSELRSFSFTNSANFTCLTRLRIFECPRLVSLPDSIDLLQVEELVFHNCARLDLNYGRSMNCLRRLQYLELIGLPKLTELPAGLQSARALHYLMIANCISLRSIHHALQHLFTLQKLFVYDCPTLSIAPDAFRALTALQSLDIRKCQNITITSTSEAGKHLVLLDGKQISDRSDDDALVPERPSFGAQTESSTSTNSPHFHLSLETFEKIESSLELLDEKYKLKVLSKWKVLAQALKAIVNLRILQQHKLYCCLFPSDYEFERDTLFQLWMVRGFLPKHWKHLFKRMIQQGYIEETDNSIGIAKYRINVGKVTALSNSFKCRYHYTFLKDEEDAKVDGSTYSNHVSVATKSIDKTMFETLERLNDLRTLLLVRDYGSSLKQIPPTFFKSCRSMQVLDLSGCHINELPSTIKYMTQLRFLDLSFTLIERIPESIQFLEELQTLKLVGCKHLHKLPRGMTKLVKLCHLDFDVLGQLTCMPKGLGSLVNLRTLSAFIVSEEDGCSVRELRTMNSLRGSLCISGLEYATGQDAIEAAMQGKYHLTGLHLRWSHSKSYNNQDRDQAFTFLTILGASPSLAELQISNYPGLNFPGWMQCLMNVVSVTLLKCEVRNQVSGLEKLPNLKHLNIYDLNEVTLIKFLKFEAIEVNFPKLETLTIDGMHSLISWTGWDESNITTAFPMLTKVSMKDCPKLPGLPFLSHLPSLEYLEISNCEAFQSLPEGKLSTSLETLIIDSCRLLKTRCLEGGADWAKIQHVPNIWIDTEDVHSSHEDTDSLSEDESEYSDDSD